MFIIIDFPESKVMPRFECQSFLTSTTNFRVVNKKPKNLTASLFQSNIVFLYFWFKGELLLPTIYNIMTYMKFIFLSNQPIKDYPRTCAVRLVTHFFSENS